MISFLSPDDHAFANGMVYERVETLEQARAAMSRYPEWRREQAARELLEVWQQFDAGAVVAPGVRLALNARLVNQGPRENVRIDGPCAIRGIVRAEGGQIHIGKFAYIGDGSIICARISISVGAATLLAHGVQVLDNNSHPTQSFQRMIQFRRMLGDKRLNAPLEIDHAPVVIGQRCWIGLNSVVAKGVSIGDDTIVGAGAVVTRSLEAGVVAAGNPAAAVRKLTPAELELPPNALDGL